MAAYNRQTGAPVWTALDDQQAYVSPMLVTLRGVRQILVVSASRAMGLAVENGRLLWEYPWSNYNGITVAQPLLLGDDRVFLSAGYGLVAALRRARRWSGSGALGRVLGVPVQADRGGAGRAYV